VLETWNIGPKPINMAVGFSNDEAACAMARYLIRQGYELLAYAGGTQADNDRTRAREAGFRRPLSEHGLSVREDLICSLPMEFESGAELARKLAPMKRRPDALFAASELSRPGSSSNVTVWVSGSRSILQSPASTTQLLPLRSNRG
jgi:DNA-binding LacI/PurR family transcriptional regulator